MGSPTSIRAVIAIAIEYYARDVGTLGTTAYQGTYRKNQGTVDVSQDARKYHLNRILLTRSTER